MIEDGRPDGSEWETSLGEAFRRADGEARPSDAFRRDLRGRFTAGTLVPSSGEVPPAGDCDHHPVEAPNARLAPVFRIPRPLAYLVAAAAAALLLVVSGALEPRAVPDPVRPVPARVSLEDQAFIAAERRLQSLPELAGRTFQRRLVEGKPYLLTAEAAFGDLDDLTPITLYLAEGEALLRQEFAEVAGHSRLPPVTVIAPTREVFAAVVAPRIAPVPLGDPVVAFALDREGVLLLSPEVLDDRNPPCEEMDIVHEGVHRWMLARKAPEAVLPLWMHEGIADVVSQAGSGMNTRAWCRQVLGWARSAGFDLFQPELLLGFDAYPEMAGFVAGNAACEDRPFAFVSLFHAQADSLVAFLLEDHPGCVHRAGFLRMVREALAGKRPDAAAVAGAAGFDSVEAMFEARDRWLGLDD